MNAAFPLWRITLYMLNDVLQPSILLRFLLCFALFVLLMFTWYTELTCPRRDVIYLEKIISPLSGHWLKFAIKTGAFLSPGKALSRNIVFNSPRSKHKILTWLLAFLVIFLYLVWELQNNGVVKNLHFFSLKPPFQRGMVREAKERKVKARQGLLPRFPDM